MIRRWIEAGGASLGLLLLSPVLIAAALAIKLGDGGAVFFLHRRIGKGGVPFELWKFRTMTPQADRPGGPITTAADPRVTPIGKFLRRSKLDELPQLWNVVRGDMQFVGPRPEVDTYVLMFPREYATLLRDRPGITDTASLAFRQEERLLSGPHALATYAAEILPAKLALSLDYSARRTWRTDLGVIFKTVLGWTPPWRLRQELGTACGRSDGPHDTATKQRPESPS